MEPNILWIHLRIFTVIFFPFSERALQYISMLFRSEQSWEVVEPAPDIGVYLCKHSDWHIVFFFSCFGLSTFCVYVSHVVNANPNLQQFSYILNEWRNVKIKKKKEKKVTTHCFETTSIFNKFCKKRHWDDG